MENKLVSIVLATYNGEKYLRKQLDSIYNQTYKNIEVIACDDCSIDLTLNILEEYRVSCGLKYYCNKKNIGFVKNFEKAVSLCKGDYIAFSDQDDIWLPNKIEILVNEIAGFSLVYSDHLLIDGEDRIITHSKNKTYRINDHSNLRFIELLFNNYIAGCLLLFKRELLSKALPIPEHQLFHDWWFAVVASKMDGIKYIHKQLVKYRQHGNNIYGVRGGGYFERILRYKEYRIKKMIKFKQRSKRLKEMLSLEMFSSDEKQIMQDAVTYYDSYINDRVPLKHYFLTLKYSKYISVRNIWRNYFR